MTCVDCGGAVVRGARGPAPERCVACREDRRRAAQRKPATERTFRALSLGAGQQSSSLLIMSSLGLLPRLDAAIFADTGWERQVVYDHLAKLEAVAARAGIPVVRVSAGDLRSGVLTSDFVGMPAFGLHGGRPMVGRQTCTVDFKIVPIRRELRRLAGPLAGLTVDLWLGISSDEVVRMKDSPVSYIRHVYPLVEMNWARKDCQRFLAEQGFPRAPRSSCIGCPYKANSQWAEMERDAPTEWADAVEFDARLNARPEPMWLHPSRKPLPLAVATGADQLDLFGNECEGHCGI